MSEIERTWMVLLRDVSHGVRVTGQDRVVASLVLHAETGLILGTHMSGTPQDALAGAFDAALSRPVMDLQPARPVRVVFAVDAASEVRRAVEAAPLGSPELVEATSLDEAEDILDSLVGHLSGRAQPSEPPTSEDWALLTRQTLEYARAEPWSRWSDASHLGLQLTINATTEHYVAIVMGNAGVQRGLALYRGTSLPKKLSMSPGAVPNGTLLLFLDPEGENPAEFTQKARRYGWPSDAALLPAWVAGSPQGPSDLSDIDAQRLQIALAAVLLLDAQGPVLAKNETTPINGEVTLSGGRLARCTISRRSSRLT